MIKLEEVESDNKFINNGIKLEKNYDECISCLELQDQITKDNEKIARLETDIVNENSVIESLEDEVRMLKRKNEELEKSGRNGGDEDEDDTLTNLMIENKVLECEKKKAESEIGVWMEKCRELERQVMELGNRLSVGMMKTGDPSVVRTQDKANEDNDSSGNSRINTPFKQYADIKGFKGGNEREFKSRVRKSLDFNGDRPHKNSSPSTPGGQPPFVTIEISDSDDDVNSENVHGSVGLGISPDENELNPKDKYATVGKSEYLPVPKRRKVRHEVAYVVNSESESDSDDNIPIGRRMSKKNMPAHSSDNSENRKSVDGSCSRDIHKEPTSRRRLLRAEHTKDKNVSTGNQNTLETFEILNDLVDEDESEEDDSSSEGESLCGFIVSDESESDDSSNCDDMSENESESNVVYDDVISGLRRERRNKKKWEFEADMLADLCKCPELCMRGVCALYRRQTCEEKFSQTTILRNGRGFSQPHASIGSELAEFLTGGDEGDVMKSVEELLEFDSKGVENCRKLATHYSKQLFEIYENGEYPFFHP